MSYSASSCSIFACVGTNAQVDKKVMMMMMILESEDHVHV